jgi:hypothetical protein
MIEKTGKVSGYNEAGRTNVGNTKGISGDFCHVISQPLS